MALVTGVARLRARHLHLPYGDQGIFVRASVSAECGRFPEIAVAEDMHFVRGPSREGESSCFPSPP